MVTVCAFYLWFHKYLKVISQGGDISQYQLTNWEIKISKASTLKSHEMAHQAQLSNWSGLRKRWSGKSKSAILQLKRATYLEPFFYTRLIGN